MIQTLATGDAMTEKSGIDGLDQLMIDLLIEKGHVDLANEYRTTVLSCIEETAIVKDAFFPPGCCKDCGQPIGLWHGVKCKPMSAGSVYHRQMYADSYRRVLEHKSARLQSIMIRFSAQPHRADDRSVEPTSSDSE